MSFGKKYFCISWISSIIVISLLAVSLGTNHWIRVVDKNTNSITYFGLNIVILSHYFLIVIMQQS